MYARFGAMGLASIFSFLMPVMSVVIDPNCDFYQEMVMGEEYYIFNLDYPVYYTPPTSCRWMGRSPVGSVIVLSCDDIELPPSTNCQNDRLSISLSGDPNLKDATNYCGQNSMTLITQDNTLAVGLISPSSSLGGRFVCALTAVKSAPPPSTTPLPNTCDCGWKQQTRIVGGQNTGVNEYPSMAAILDVNTTEAYCGASIISEKYALTAAHCLLHKVPSDIGLLVGDYDLSTGSDTAAAALYRIIYFKQHPQYDQPTQQNDIAILQTASPIAFSVYVGPVCLPFRYSWTDFYAQTVTALGWGFMDFSGNKSEILQKVDLSIVSNSDCVAAIPEPVTDQQICTYAPNKDTCLSDSGGPLLWQDANTRRLQLVGIISYGVGCATKKPAVNTRVTSYLTWIVSETRDAVYCIK